MNTEKVIAQAKAWLGCNEYDGSFRQIIDVYNSIGNGIPMDYSWPWCACFVSAVYFKAVNETRFAEISCDRMIEKLQRLGVYSVTGRPDVGDIIFYDWDNNGSSDHVGILAEIDGNAWTIIEGNKSDAVGYRTISASYPFIKGYGFATRLKGEETVQPTPTETVGQQMADHIIANRRWPTLKLYSKGEWVKVLQAMLNAENKAGLEVDGDFGVFTYSAVNKFQTAHGLERDGIVGEKTWGELRK